MKPIGERTILKVDLAWVERDGEKRQEPSQEGKVMETTIEGLKKGDKVFFNNIGAVATKQTKKDIVLIVDNEDVWAKL